MVLPSTSRRKYWAAFVYLVLVLQACNGFYVPGTYMHTYSNGEKIFAKVDSLTSTETKIQLSYYSLPYCKPQGGVKRSAENVEEMLMGDQIDISPYLFRMNVNESLYLCSTPPLNEHEVNLLGMRIRDLYQVNMILDNLPVMSYGREQGVKIQWTGFPVGYIANPESDNDYIINHLKFRILIHENEGAVESEADEINKASGYEIVGFEVVPCSIKYDPEKMSKLQMYDKVEPVEYRPGELSKFQIIKEHERVSFTYEVEFVKSDIRWPSRWDSYLKMEGTPVDWFYIFNSLWVIFVLAAIVFLKFRRRVIRDLRRYEELDKEAQAQVEEGLSGWKLVIGDVFREPKHSKLLSVLVGNGVQITGMAVVTIVFAAYGLVSPASRDMLLTAMVLLYLFLGITAGYVGVRLWRTIKGTSEGWRSVSWSIACFFPGIVSIILTVLNFVLAGSKSTTAAIPISLYLAFLSIWFCILVPLTLVGGYLGTRAEPIQYPVRTNQIPREIPARNYPSRLLLLLGAGALPSGTLFIVLFFNLSHLSIVWLGQSYHVLGFLFGALLLLVFICAEVSVILTYMHLCVEDWMWWWKAFYASGSVALYLFLYSIKYLVLDLQSLSGPISAMVYLGYSLIMAIAVMLSTGTIGFLASFYFVHCLFSSVKVV